MLGVLFCSQTEEKGAFFKGTLRFSSFIASFENALTLRFADYIEQPTMNNNAIKIFFVMICLFLLFNLIFYCFLIDYKRTPALSAMAD